MQYRLSATSTQQGCRLAVAVTAIVFALLLIAVPSGLMISVARSTSPLIERSAAGFGIAPAESPNFDPEYHFEESSHYWILNATRVIALITASLTGLCAAVVIGAQTICTIRIDRLAESESPKARAVCPRGIGVGRRAERDLGDLQETAGVPF